MRLLENPPNRAPGPADDNREAQHVPIGARQLPRPAGSPPDAGRRDELPHVLEGPAVARRILPVVERDEAVRTERDAEARFRQELPAAVGFHQLPKILGPFCVRAALRERRRSFRASAGNAAHERAPRVLSLQPSTVS